MTTGLDTTATGRIGRIGGVGRMVRKGGAALTRVALATTTTDANINFEKLFIETPRCVGNKQGALFSPEAVSTSSKPHQLHARCAESADKTARNIAGG